jgi:metallo-beta-lactamase family protein
LGPLPILASTIDFVLLTHGHLDHLWLVAEISRSRLSWKNLLQRTNKGNCKLILLDSAKIQEEEAENKG